MDFGNHIFLKKHLGDFKEEHPLLANIDSNPKYMDYVETLLKELDGIPNLKTKINKMKKSDNWESIFWELEFCNKIKTLNPEFIKELKNGQRTVDIKAPLCNEDVFFEIGLLTETDGIREIKKEIGKLESNLEVKLNYVSLGAYKTHSLIEFIKNKIVKKELGFFSHEGTDIEIYKKSSKTTKTSVYIPVKSARRVTAESLRKKIVDAFYDKLTQLKNYRPIFWVIGCGRWKFDWEEFNEAIFDTKKLYGTRNEAPRLHKEEGGLFYLKDAECLNGIITKIHEKYYSFINPFAKQHLSVESKNKIKELFNGI